MKRPALTGIFCLLFAAYWLQLLFPFLVLAGALAGGGLSPGAALYGEVLFALLAVWGYFYTRLLCQSRRRLLGLTRPLIALLCGAAGFFISPFSAALPSPLSLSAQTLFALLCAAAFITGTLLYGHSYSELGTGRPIAWLALTYLGAAAALWGMQRLGLAEYRLDLLTLSLGFAFAAYALCRNQANIDFHMERRRHRLELLPQKIRLYNLRLMLGVSVLTLLLFLLRGPIAGGLRALGRGLRALIFWIFFLLDRLANLFYREKETPPDTPSAVADPFAGFQDGPYESIPDWWVYLFLILITAALLWWKRREILQLLLTGMEKLWRLIRRLFSFSSALHLKGEETESPYYTDEIVSLPPEQEKLQKAARRSAAREWKKSYGRYLRMPEQSEEQQSEKFRCGYRLVLQYLALSGCYASADTVHELEKRALSLPGMQEYSAAAGGYDRVRYGEYAPSAGESAALQQMLTGIAAQAVGKKNR